MSSQYETGHAKNLANLLKYNQFITSLGAAYNPPLAAISLASLTTLYNDAKTRLDALKTAQDTWKADTNNREIEFDKLGAFTTRLLGVLRSTTAPQQTLDDFAFLVSRVRGDTKKAAPVKPEVQAAADPSLPVPEPPLTRSSSQQSFDLRAENFSKMVLLLQGVTTYTPSEPDLNITGIQALLAKLLDLNARATTADVNLRMARAARNSFLYEPETGVLDLIKKSKAYVLGVYGRTSEQNKIASSFKFTVAA